MSQRAWVKQSRCRALCPPSVRMVVLSVYSLDESEGGGEARGLEPVVALGLYRKRIWTGMGDPVDARYEKYPSSRLRNTGWTVEREEEEVVALVHDEFYQELLPWNAWCRTHSSITYRPLVCPWPADQDAMMFEPVYVALERFRRTWVASLFKKPSSDGTLT